MPRPQRQSKYSFLLCFNTQISHQVQVYFYWRALQEILPLDTFIASPTASIWLLNEEKPTPFSPFILKPQMDSFLFSFLPRVVELDRENVPWHYNSLCSTCQWKQDCKERTEQEDTVSMIPDLSVEEAGFLRETIQLSRQNPPVTDIEELELLARKRLKPLEKQYPTTARRFRRILALKRGEDGPGPVLTAVKSQAAQVCPLITVLT
jgi:predicted RecB family nuclease